MNVDPRMTELARAVQRERVVAPKSASVLGPVRVLIAEFIYLDMAKIDIYEFVKRAGIGITYPGMCMWVSRNFGTGKEAVQKAAEIVQAAVDQGEFTSPYFSPNRPNPGTSHEISPPRNSRPALVALVHTPASSLSEAANAATTPTEKKDRTKQTPKSITGKPRNTTANGGWDTGCRGRRRGQRGTKAAAPCAARRSKEEVRFPIQEGSKYYKSR